MIRNLGLLFGMLVMSLVGVGAYWVVTVFYFDQT